MPDASCELRHTMQNTVVVQRKRSSGAVRRHKSVWCEVHKPAALKIRIERDLHRPVAVVKVEVDAVTARGGLDAPDLEAHGAPRCVEQRKYASHGLPAGHFLEACLSDHDLLVFIGTVLSIGVLHERVACRLVEELGGGFAPVLKLRGLDGGIAQESVLHSSVVVTQNARAAFPHSDVH